MSEDTALEERIQARIDRLKVGREDHVRDAKLALEGFNAAIGELEALLRPAPDETPAAPEPDEQ